MNVYSLEGTIGRTPLVRLERMPEGSSLVAIKLEGNNPGGSVKDRPALSMIRRALERGDITPETPIIEATSGNTGIGLAMVAAALGLKTVLVMPESATVERRAVMRAYGAELVLTPADRGMEGAIDRARAMESAGEGRIINQFGNPDNPLAHYEGTGPEIWEDTDGRITHFVASMGTTGTIMGTGRFLKERRASVQIVGVQPEEGAQIPGIRKWPKEYLPSIFDERRVDRTISVTRQDAEETARRLAREEGILAGISTGGNVFAALQVAAEIENGVVVTVQCDRGDRYLSTGQFGP